MLYLFYYVINILYGSLMNSSFMVTFQIKYQTHPGQEIYILGGIPELGSWKNLEFKLKWTPGHIWEKTLTLSSDCNSFHYKFVCYDSNDKSRRWEDGQNRYFNKLFLSDSENLRTHTLFCTWEMFLLTFLIYYPLDKEYEYFQIIGNHPTIGNWFRENGKPTKMELSGYKNLNSKFVL